MYTVAAGVQILLIDSIIEALRMDMPLPKVIVIQVLVKELPIQKIPGVLDANISS